MATRKKIPSKTPPTPAEFTAVLEDLHSKFDVFGEALHGVRDEVQGLRDELHGFRSEVDCRFGRVEHAVLENSREIREVRATVTRIEATLATKVDRAEVEAIVASRRA